MKSLQLSLVVAIALCTLLWSTLWVMAQSDPEPVIDPVADATVEASAIEAVGLAITATVGRAPSVCATSRTIEVLTNTIVYYCYTLRHTGVSGDPALTVHDVQTSRGVNRRNLSLPVNPGTSVVVTQGVSAEFNFLTDTTNVDVANVVTWTARTADSASRFTATSISHINVVTPALNVVTTVGQDRASCPAARSLRVPSGQNVAFCVTVQNQGDITFTNHMLTGTQPAINATFAYSLAPGASVAIYPSVLSNFGPSGSLEQNNVTGPVDNRVSYTARTATGLSVTRVSTASVDVGNTTVRFTKTVSTRPEDCSGNANVTVPPGTRVYYCAIIVNTGAVSLTQHQLTEQYLSIDVRFNYDLLPGQTLTVTNDFLARQNEPIVFGPFEINPIYGNVINNTMTYSATSSDGLQVSASAASTAQYPPTPTPTRTDEPDPTSTNTPPPTGTPTSTSIPVPATETPTPTFTPVTPSPTPTRSYAISSLATPTPRAESANMQQGMPTQAVAQLPDQSQLPVQEPALTTATQIAIDATATTVALEATATQAILDSAATATFQASSPLATPTLPFPDGGQAGLPTGEGTPIMPSGMIATETPAIIATVTASETPEVLVLVVTNTPDPALALLPDGQRPIVYPTPTATADYVMAAARTVDTAVTTFGWLWFLVGSLIFFVTAGVVAGFFFRQAEVNRYELVDSDFWLEEEPLTDRDLTQSETGRSTDEDWPADLR
jgi:hypothetical protein